MRGFFVCAEEQRREQNKDRVAMVRGKEGGKDKERGG